MSAYFYYIVISHENRLKKIEPESRKERKRLLEQWEESVGEAVINLAGQLALAMRLLPLRAKRSKTQPWNGKHDGVQQTHRRDAHMSSFEVKENSHSLSSGEFYLLAGSQAFSTRDLVPCHQDLA